PISTLSLHDALPISGAALPGPRPPGVRGDLPAVSLPLVRQLRGAGLRGGEIRDVAAAPPEVASGRAVEGSRTERPAGRVDGPLPDRKSTRLNSSHVS